MQTPREYAKQEAQVGRVASIIIQQDAGEFWLFDGDWKLLKGAPYKTREQAGAARSSAINWADQFWVDA